MRRVVPDEAGLDLAARVLLDGGLVAFPTETVYGLGALGTNDAAIGRVYAAKGRPAHNPLILHVATAAGARALGRFDERAERLAEAFWPGPLTLVLPRRAPGLVSKRATAGLDTLALRLPGQPVARALLARVGLPVAAPSANPSGRMSPTRPEHVANDLGDAVDLLIDGGPCPLGVESTVIDLSRPEVARILRPGGLPRAAVGALAGGLTAGTDADEDAAPRAPGLLRRHYAPGRPLRLEAADVASDEALLAFGPAPLIGAKLALNLSHAGNLDEAARNLFAHLHALDRADVAAIAVMPVPNEGVGEAINDRLRRAAATD